MTQREYYAKHWRARLVKLGRDYAVPGEPEKTRAIGTQKLRGMVARDFQLMIRMEAADDHGMCQCVTCPSIQHYKEMDAGHFIGGRNNAALFCELNCHPQCKTDNGQRHGGKPEVYAQFILETYGQQALDYLNTLRHATVKYYRSDYLEMRAEYRARIKIQKQRLGH